jgi:hypothetical protein
LGKKNRTVCRRGAQIFKQINQTNFIAAFFLLTLWKEKRIKNETAFNFHADFIGKHNCRAANQLQ